MVLKYEVEYQKNLGGDDMCSKCANINIYLVANKIITFLPMYVVLE
jgi:hypothetical protein